MELNTIACMDCFDYMLGIPESSIDLVLVDLPYGVTANEWDIKLDLEALWEHWTRILKSDGMVVLTATQPFASELVMSNRQWFRYDWIAQKRIPVGFLNANRRPLLKHESVLVFSEIAPRYYPQMTVGKQHKRGRSHRSTSSNNYSGYHDFLYYSNEYYPTSLIDFGLELSHTQTYKQVPSKRAIHPTEKPVSLFAYLIKTYTQAGDVVLDHCMGSGTTAVACVHTGRNYLGCDLNPDYVAMAWKRIAKADLTQDTPITNEITQLSLFRNDTQQTDECLEIMTMNRENE